MSYGIMMMPVLLGIAGCSTKISVFDIVDYRDSGQPKRYRETFDEAYYNFDAGGNLDLVLRRREPDPANPSQEITQVIHLQSVWRSIPGTTVAERTQINATVSYSIIGGRVGALFNGAGSLFVNENKKRNTLQGTLEFALLKPRRRLSLGQEFFKQAQLTGQFCATRDRRRAVRIINDTNRLFGSAAGDTSSG